MTRPTARSAPGAPVVAAVQPFDLSMQDALGQAAVAARAAAFFAGLDAGTPVRVLAHSRPFSADPALRALQALRRACPPAEPWRASHLAAYQTFLDTLVRLANLRGADYFLLAWPPPALPPPLCSPPPPTPSAPP